MKRHCTLLITLLAMCMPLWAQPAPTLRNSEQPMPSLKKTGAVTQMIVDGKPFIMLAGELHNSSASSLEYMKPLWNRLAMLNLNTVIAPVSWELLEPEEGKFDFALVDGMIQEARQYGLRLILIWFGSWKNGNSSYAPHWVKTNLERFPRMQSVNGTNLEVLSPLGQASLAADAKALGALMSHIRSVDARRTVVMMQVENEVGLLGESRDRSPLAQTAWSKPVPADLTRYLQENRAKLLPELAKIWEAHGSKSAGTWPEVFGSDAFGDEVFMAWHMGRYVGKVIQAGKAEYPLPMFVNAWLVQREGQLPGEYPSGGPVSRMKDVWRAAAPKLDFLSPDIYIPDFRGVCASYTQSENPLFIPEAQNGPMSVGNLFWAVGQHAAMGYSPFGIDDLPENLSLVGAYKVLSEMTPVITQYQTTGNVIGVLENNAPHETRSLNGYKLQISYFARIPQRQPQDRPNAYGLIIATEPDEFLVAGSGFSMLFLPDSVGPRIAHIDFIDEGRFVNGRWTPGRRLNGDESDGGQRLILPDRQIGIQKIRLYRHN